MTRPSSPNQEKTLVLHIHKRFVKNEHMRSSQAKLEEALGLTQAIDLPIVEGRIISLQRPSPATLLQKGNVEILKTFIQDQKITLVIMDTTLTPIQQRNLERAWSCKVIDRTALILEIFGARAKTSEGRLQVDLAQLSYQRSRLVRSWTHLERQRGGHGFLGGPGESQMELDRRMIDEKIMALKKQLEKIKRTRGLHRQARKRVPYPTIALVGYTNAGKSTLFNQLTQASVFAKDLLFATLDPTMRQIHLPGGQKAILSDTVGFVSDLPTQLIAAFQATLEEVCSADLLIIVQDSSHPDQKAQLEDVHQVLKDLGLEKNLFSDAILYVYNKVDCLTDQERQDLLERLSKKPSHIALSALKNEGLEDLLTLIAKHLHHHKKLMEIKIPVMESKFLAWCYKVGSVLQRKDLKNHIKLSILFEEKDLPSLQEKLKAIPSYKG